MFAFPAVKHNRRLLLWLPPCLFLLCCRISMMLQASICNSIILVSSFLVCKIFWNVMKSLLMYNYQFCHSNPVRLLHYLKSNLITIVDDLVIDYLTTLCVCVWIRLTRRRDLSSYATLNSWLMKESDSVASSKSWNCRSGRAVGLSGGTVVEPVHPLNLANKHE